MRRIIFFALVCAVFTGCARPDKGPSPFDALDEPLLVEAQPPEGPLAGSDFKIIADETLVYGAGMAAFNSDDYVAAGSRLAGYAEEVDETLLSGIEIVEKVSREYSVNPKLLLALLEYQAGWVRGVAEEAPMERPFLAEDPLRIGLFRQLSWAANELNRGFYSRRVGGLAEFILADGSRVLTSPNANDASAAVQYLLGKLEEFHEWQTATGPLGLYATYIGMFAEAPENPSASDPGAAGMQPELRLPFEKDAGWFFTSGPHSAWGDGAAWAALDFAPDEDNFGCYDSQAWVTAAADGLVVRSADGQVVQDLDGDGDEGSGWTILYMHIAERERVAAGKFLKAGERIGHPSCEGGPATGTHLHVARRWNGEWIPADQDLPFVLSGWVSSGDGVEYDGTLAKDGKAIPASGFPGDENKITP